MLHLDHVYSTLIWALLQTNIEQRWANIFVHTRKATTGQQLGINDSCTEVITKVLKQNPGRKACVPFPASLRPVLLNLLSCGWRQGLGTLAYRQKKPLFLVNLEGVDWLAGWLAGCLVSELVGEGCPVRLVAWLVASVACLVGWLVHW